MSGWRISGCRYVHTFMPYFQWLTCFMLLGWSTEKWLQANDFRGPMQSRIREWETRQPHEQHVSPNWADFGVRYSKQMVAAKRLPHGSFFSNEGMRCNIRWELFHSLKHHPVGGFDLWLCGEAKRIHMLENTHWWTECVNTYIYIYIYTYTYIVSWKIGMPAEMKCQPIGSEEWPDTIPCLPIPFVQMKRQSWLS